MKNGGNERVFPFAINLEVVENDKCWTWFFSKLKSCFDLSNDLLIAIKMLTSKMLHKWVHPNVTCEMCYYHVQKNLVRYNAHVEPIFQSAAYSYRGVEFNELLTALGAVRRESLI